MDLIKHVANLAMAAAVNGLTQAQREVMRADPANVDRLVEALRDTMKRKWFRFLDDAKQTLDALPNWAGVEVNLFAAEVAREALAEVI